MKRFITSGIAAFMLPFLCVFIGVFLVGLFMPFVSPMTERTLENWYAASTTTVFVLGLGYFSQYLVRDNFRKVEPWLIAPLVVFFVSSGTRLFFLLGAALFICGWIIIWRIWTIRKEMTG